MPDAAPSAQELTHVAPSFGEPGAAYVYQPKALGARYPQPEAPRLSIVLPEAPLYMLFAHRVWRAGMLLADAIYAGAVDVRNANVLELGAGTGLPALTAAVCGGARFVVATDYDDDSILAALRANVKRTLADHTEHAPIVVAAHTWGHRMDDISDLLSARAPVLFDAILLADCVWERFSHDALVKSITALLARTPSARVYMVAGLHTGRATLVHFFRRMLAAGLVLVPVPGDWPAENAPAQGEADDEYVVGRQHILELEVAGGDAGDASAAAAAAAAAADAASDAPAPGLSGTRRPFVVHTPHEEPVAERNHWLTVSCFAWPMSTSN